MTKVLIDALFVFAVATLSMVQIGALRPEQKKSTQKWKSLAKRLQPGAKTSHHNVGTLTQKTLSKHKKRAVSASKHSKQKGNPFGDDDAFKRLRNDVHGDDPFKRIGPHDGNDLFNHMGDMHGQRGGASPGPEKPSENNDGLQKPANMHDLMWSHVSSGCRKVLDRCEDYKYEAENGHESCVCNKTGSGFLWFIVFLCLCFFFCLGLGGAFMWYRKPEWLPNTLTEYRARQGVNSANDGTPSAPLAAESNSGAGDQ